jgi:hypothetical protein
MTISKTDHEKSLALAGESPGKRGGLQAHGAVFEESDIDVGDSYAAAEVADLAQYQVPGTKRYRIPAFVWGLVRFEAVDEDLTARVVAYTDPLDDTGSTLGSEVTPSAGNSALAFQNSDDTLRANDVCEIEFQLKYTSSDGGTAKIGGFFS